MATWSYENGNLVAKDAHGNIIYQRAMARQAALGMAEMLRRGQQEEERLLGGKTAAPEPGKTSE